MTSSADDSGIQGSRLEEAERRISQLEEVLNGLGTVLEIADKSRHLRSRAHLRLAGKLALLCATVAAGTFILVRRHEA